MLNVIYLKFRFTLSYVTFFSNCRCFLFCDDVSFFPSIPFAKWLLFECFFTTLSIAYFSNTSIRLLLILTNIIAIIVCCWYNYILAIMQTFLNTLCVDVIPSEFADTARVAGNVFGYL